MSDIVERLRSGTEHKTLVTTGLVNQAADEIERLRAALRPLACTCPARHQAECSRSETDCPFWNARAALKEDGDE